MDDFPIETFNWKIIHKSSMFNIYVYGGFSHINGKIIHFFVGFLFL